VTAGVEVAVALAVVAGVAIGTSGRRDAGGSTTTPPVALASWWVNAVPVVTNLVGDLTAVERSTSSAVSADPAALAVDGAGLERDLSEARRLPAPPNRPAAELWSEILAQFATPQRTLAAAAATLSPATVALAHSQFINTGGAFIQLSQQLRAETS
jgi:hypothetical protein